MICIGARPIDASARRRAISAQRKVQADVEQQEDDAEFGEEAGRIPSFWTRLKPDGPTTRPATRYPTIGPRLAARAARAAARPATEIDDRWLQGFDGRHVLRPFPILPPSSPDSRH